MPKGTRAIITMGEVSGIIEAQNAMGELGSLKMLIMTIIERMIGIIPMGSMTAKSTMNALRNSTVLNNERISIIFS